MTEMIPFISFSLRVLNSDGNRSAAQKFDWNDIDCKSLPIRLIAIDCVIETQSM